LILLVVSIVLLLVSLLAILPAPTNKTWRLKVGVTEFPLLFVGISMIVFCFSIFSHFMQLAPAIVCFFSMVLFFTPYTRAQVVARTILSEDKEDQSHPLSFKTMLTGVSIRRAGFETMVYKNNGKKDFTLDYYSSGSVMPSACIVVVHGGGWDSGDSKQLDRINSLFVSLGYSVAAINYSLAPQYNCPEPVNDVLDAIAFLKAQSSLLKIDAKRFVLLGRSAGGQIALLTAYTANDTTIKGVIAFYPPADMVWAWSVPGNPWIMDSRTVLKNYIGDTFENAPEKFHAASPLEFVNASSTPTLLIHGVSDEMVAYEHSRRLNDKLKKLGVCTKLLTLPWATHACDFTLSGPSGQLSTYVIKGFLKNKFATI